LSEEAAGAKGSAAEGRQKGNCQFSPKPRERSIFTGERIHLSPCCLTMLHHAASMPGHFRVFCLSQRPLVCRADPQDLRNEEAPPVKAGLS
jgi:hypothetical protein